jgi:hypothetical protein
MAAMENLKFGCCVNVTDGRKLYHHPVLEKSRDAGDHYLTCAVSLENEKRQRNRTSLPLNLGFRRRSLLQEIAYARVA